tara:strand:+ start:2632 stop:2844 length:213 start_codon:yes stop_codon:yes gene_type:complete
MNSESLENLKLQALAESHKSYSAFQHGCVIVRNGKIVATGFNDENSHAECRALNSLKKGYRLLRGQGEEC